MGNLHGKFKTMDNFFLQHYLTFSEFAKSCYTVTFYAEQLFNSMCPPKCLPIFPYGNFFWYNWNNSLTVTFMTKMLRMYLVQKFTLNNFLIVLVYVKSQGGKENWYLPNFFRFFPTNFGITQKWWYLVENLIPLKLQSVFWRVF